MINAYTSLVNNEEYDYEEYLKRVHLFDIFKDVIKEYKDREDSFEVIRGVVMFITFSYSIESDMLFMNGESWERTRERIFKKTNLPDDLFEDVALLKNISVQTSIERWLRLQNSEEFSNFTHFRDLRSIMLSSCTGGIIKSTGEQDYEQRMKNAIHAKELLEMMKEALAKYVQNSPKLKNSIKAFEEVQLNRNTATVEDFLNKSR